MLSSDKILDAATVDGSIDVAEWPRVLESVLQRLHEIVHNEFPLPKIPEVSRLSPSIDPHVIAASPPSGVSPSRLPSGSALEDTTDQVEPSSQSSESTNKENTAPPGTISTRPPVPPFSSSSRHGHTQRHISDDTSSPLPPDLQSSYQTTVKSLRHDFAQSPPYTIQRLAELVLYPKKHYRFLPPYLAALDRTVSVASSVSAFPLAQLQLSGANGGFLTNGESTTNGSHEREGLGSDESLGGALLTPIPWLRRESINVHAATTAHTQDGELRTEGHETIEGPNGAGRIETVSVTVNGVASTAHPNALPGAPDATVDDEQGMSREQALRAEGAVTQGELLRQEQEAGVVPVGQTAVRRPLIGVGAAAVGRDVLSTSVEDMDKPEDHPHARGPELIGMEDMGPQEGSLGVSRPLDMEAAVGRGRSKSPQPPEQREEPMTEESEQGIATEPRATFDVADDKDAEGDIVLEDASATQDPTEASEAAESHSPNNVLEIAETGVQIHVEPEQGHENAGDA